VKELGSCDLYPQSLRHNPNGRFVVVCGDGEYIIYTALAWRNRSFGSALEIVWSTDGEYAVRESTSRIKIFSKNFQERKSIRPTFSTERVFGGVLLAMCTNDFICFYDWADCRLIRRIDVNVKNVYWADSGDLVTVASDTSFYILKYNYLLIWMEGVQLARRVWKMPLNCFMRSMNASELGYGLVIVLSTIILSHGLITA
jgi:coatomer subunit beta'